MSDVSFWINGEPRAKQSTRFDGNGHAHTDPKIKAWQDYVSVVARDAMNGEPPMTGPVEMCVTFYLGNHRRVDLDNLNKAVSDALNGIVFADDNQVVTLELRKKFDKAAPRVGVWITPHDEEAL